MEGESRLAYFAEDDYCQIQFLPVSTERFVAQEMQRLADFIAQHRQPNGTYDDVYIRPEPPENLLALNISDAAVSLSLYPAFRRYTGVITGPADQPQPCPTVHGWGDDDFALFAAVPEPRRVSDLFLARSWTADGAARAAAVLPELPDADQLLLVDWDRLQWRRLTHRRELEAYLHNASA